MINEDELKSFFESVKSINFLVLRGQEHILEDINNGGDIDILVDTKVSFVSRTKAKSLNELQNSYNYSVLIGNEIVPIDLRVVGDGYYDVEWEKNMLRNRQFIDGLPVLNKEDYKYSLMYHCIIHKKSIPQKYMSYFEENGILDIDSLISELDSFMIRNGYKYVRPLDKGVSFNRGMMVNRKMQCFIKSLVYFKNIKRIKN